MQGRLLVKVEGKVIDAFCKKPHALVLGDCGSADTGCLWLVQVSQRRAGDVHRVWAACV